MPHDFQATAASVVHQKQGDTIVHQEIAGTNQLPVSLVVSKGQCM
jgi:hypothetical protein